MAGRNCRFRATASKAVLSVGVSLIAVLASGCGSSDPPLWSCDNGDLEICIEYESLPPEARSQFMRVCEFGMGRWADRGCPRDQVYIGCKLANGGFAETLWEKKPDNVEQVARTCPGQVVYGKASPDAGARGDARP
jgi:hypothetical protein